ncbi:MAG: pantoate--beta-alanine ligase [Planctomycetes bacterium]|nr:pantoate--beta-alanine ligase [Planctomycetota bacterium]
MKHLDDLSQLSAATAAWRAAGLHVGFVPTMGALHAGHLSLVGAARAACDRVVVSVFLNPTQFGPNEDLDAYPSDLARDRALLEEAGVDALFTTSPSAMYPDGFATWVEVEGLTDRLCGASREGHFRGVTTVVTKLLNLVGPCRAFFGEKDRQQLVVLQRMVADLNLPVEAVGCPIVREPDGLALSSRNAYLDPAERTRALALSQGLRDAQQAFAGGETSGPALEAAVRARLEAAAAELDYVELVDPGNLARLAVAVPGAVLAVAAKVGSTRLIDNHALGQPWR